MAEFADPEAVQTGDDVADVVLTAMVTDSPAFRHQTSHWAQDVLRLQAERPRRLGRGGDDLGLGAARTTPDRPGDRVSRWGTGHGGRPHAVLALGVPHPDG